MTFNNNTSENFFLYGLHWHRFLVQICSLALVTVVNCFR